MKFDFTKYVSTDDFMIRFSSCIFCKGGCKLDKGDFNFICEKCKFLVGLESRWGDNETPNRWGMGYVPTPRCITAVFFDDKFSIWVRKNVVTLHYENVPALGFTKKKIILEANPIDLDEIRLISHKYRVLI